MNKKFLLLISLLMMISFSTGVFVELISPGKVSLAAETPAFLTSLLGNIKSDMFTIALAIFFTFTIYLMPCIGLLVLCKTFSLGFSSAYLLSLSEHGSSILLAVILPRAILKLPAYIALIILSFETAKRLKSSRRDIARYIKGYALCLLAMAFSSLLEVVLLQAAL